MISFYVGFKRLLNGFWTALEINSSKWPEPHTHNNVVLIALVHYILSWLWIFSFKIVYSAEVCAPLGASEHLECLIKMDFVVYVRLSKWVCSWAAKLMTSLLDRYYAKNHLWAAVSAWFDSIPRFQRWYTCAHAQKTKIFSQFLSIDSLFLFSSSFGPNIFFILYNSGSRSAFTQPQMPEMAHQNEFVSPFQMPHSVITFFSFSLIIYYVITRLKMVLIPSFQADQQCWTNRNRYNSSQRHSREISVHKMYCV